MKRFFALTEAGAVGRRPRRATGSCSVGCLHDRHYTTLLLWCAAGPLTGCIPKWGRVSGYLWGVTLGCSARYSGQPQIWDAPLSQGASQDGGEFLATSGELHWDAQPATLDNPKSGLHPSHRLHPIFLGKRCLNQDFRDLWIDRMADDGPIPIRWVSSRRLKRHTAVAK